MTLTAGLMAAVLQFHQRTPSLGYTLRRSFDLLRAAMAEVTQIVLAVASSPDLASVSGYCWLSLLADEPVALLNQAWTRSPADTVLLHDAAVRWARDMGATAMRAWGQPGDLETGVRLYARYGFVPRAVLMEKPLGVSVMRLTREARRVDKLAHR